MQRHVSHRKFPLIFQLCSSMGQVCSMISAINSSDFILAMDGSDLQSAEMKSGPLKTHPMARMLHTRERTLGSPFPMQYAPTRSSFPKIPEVLEEREVSCQTSFYVLMWDGLLTCHKRGDIVLDKAFSLLQTKTRIHSLLRGFARAFIFNFAVVSADIWVCGIFCIRHKILEMFTKLLNDRIKGFICRW